MDLAKLLPWLAASAMIFGPLTSWLARRRLRQPFLWLVYGAVLGPLATALVVLAPPGRCPSCDEPVRGWATACESCGQPLSSALDELAGAPGTASPREAREVVLAPPVAPLDHSPASPPLAETPSTAIVASGVFVGGVEGLEPGARYALARHGNLLWVVGPVDSTPGAVRFERAVDDIEVGAIGDRLLITPRGVPHGPLLLSFQAVVGLDESELEHALATGPAPPPRGDRGRRPAGSRRQ